MRKDLLIGHDGLGLHSFFDVHDYSQLGDAYGGIRTCIASAFGGNITEEDAQNHARGNVVLVGINQEGETTCFGSAEIGSPNSIFGREDITNETGLYVAGVAINRRFQGQGLYKTMLHHMLDFGMERDLQLVFTRTQNPRVLEGLQSTLDERARLGKLSSYARDDILVPDCYGQMLTDKEPTSRSVQFPEIRYSKGDAYIFLFRIQS